MDIKALKEMNAKVIEEFRSRGGVVGGQFEGAPMMLLTHRGAKTGHSYTTPLVHSRSGDDLVIIASKAGAPDHPQWFHNLVANPEVTVEVGTERYQARAVVTQGEERDRLFKQQADQMPYFYEYQQKTKREIPVIRLQRL